MIDHGGRLEVFLFGRINTTKIWGIYASNKNSQDFAGPNPDQVIAWLIAERNIGAIGHEPADTDPSKVTSRTDAYPFPSEKFILDHDRIQIEVLAHLDELPATGSIMICAFPKLKDGTGFSARCFAICPAE